MNRMTRRRLTALLVAAALPLPAALAAPAAVRAVLYKNPQCDCCEAYAAYLRREGLDVEVRPVNDLDAISRRAGVPDGMEGCHLVVIEGYVVEGHVQASTVRKLLAERPAGIAAITLPGMPTGTPGMPGPKQGPLTIHAIGKAGGAPTVYDVQ
jgi:hypothetical protein